MRELKDNEAVYCRTQEEFNSIIKELKKQGFKCKKTINENEFYRFDTTCVGIYKDEYIAYDSISYLKANGFIILNYDDVMNGESK